MPEIKTLVVYSENELKKLSNLKILEYLNSMTVFAEATSGIGDAALAELKERVERLDRDINRAQKDKEDAPFRYISFIRTKIH